MNGLAGVSGSELLFYGGIIMMAAAVIAALPVSAVLIFAKRRLERKLEQEYGKPEQ